jgi:lipopolysaccharide/colanic/teichoic acid biosynthesis glycosyltransferase
VLASFDAARQMASAPGSRPASNSTGWAQVNGPRGDASIAERTRYDLWYVENWSLSLDIKVIIQTLFGIFFDRHTY